MCGQLRKAGRSVCIGVRHNRLKVAAIGVVLIAVAPAQAEARHFTIAAGSLGSSVILLAQQADLTIGVTDPTITALRTRSVTGYMSIHTALGRLLAGTGCTFAFIDARTVRIFRAQVARPTRPGPAPKPQKESEPTIAAEIATEIVVTASKQGTALNRCPGTVSIIDLNDPRAIPSASQGTEAIVDRLPMLSSTSLGPGREKLFVRGVADSSFSGPSQATVGQYLGDVRLNYSAPDPNLNLYDIGRVEVLEGPQGTLYGTGSLGGIVRLVPNLPNASGFSASLAAGFAATRKGATGGDIVAMINVPVVLNRVAVRAVAYRASNAGYIGDVGRGLSNINRTLTTGGRLTTRITPGDNWTIDLGGAYQTIDVRDGQYALADLPPLTRRSQIAQPFDNHYGLGFVAIKKVWGTTELTSTTSYVGDAISTTFDATGFPSTVGPIRFDENVKATLLSHETRISGRGEHRSWIIGLSAIHAVDRLRRQLGSSTALLPILGVRNEATEAALFGQYSFAIAAKLNATLGGRITYAQAIGETLDNPVSELTDPKRSSFVALPMAALSWQARDRIVVFAQVQEGYRPGGLAISASGSVSAIQRFDADRISTLEAGLRFGFPQRSRFWGSVTASYARWVDIQSDLVDATGLPFTTNIGDGRIIGLEGQMTWRASPHLTFDGSTFINKSQLDKPAPLYIAALDRELPSIAEAGTRVGFRYHTSLTDKVYLTLDGSARYVGKSSLGIGQLLGLDQGDYFDSTIGGHLALGTFGLSLDVRNLGDVRGNRFAFGNPFSIAAGNQVTPLRPRTIRIGFSAKF